VVGSAGTCGYAGSPGAVRTPSSGPVKACDGNGAEKHWWGRGQVDVGRVVCKNLQLTEAVKFHFRFRVFQAFNRAKLQAARSRNRG